VITAQPAHKLRALQTGAKDFISKPFDLAEVLMRVHNMLEVRLLHRELRNYSKALEQKVREVEASRELIRRQSDELKSLFAKVVAEQKVSERLLLNMLPYPIAERLKAHLDGMADGFPQVIADRFPEVSVLFADIVDFTGFSAGMSPEELVEMRNDIFTDFAIIADNRGREKIKTICDAYMAAAGLPVPVADHAVRAAHMALDMIDALARFNALRHCNLQLRIGINSGEVVAGVIGKRKFIYDLWGVAVNLASRMESQGVAGRVQVTEATRGRLGDPFVFEERGTIATKGMGELRTWFLVGRTGVLEN
jgi:adenylate cyclase